MKTQALRRKNAFTLVELLVVIAIIAVLAGAGFAAGNAAIQKAKRVTAQATAVAIEPAINNFYTEYGAMPTDKTTEGAADAAEVDTTDTTLLKVLLGLETSNPPLNTRAIKFLSVKEGKKKGTGGINGLLYSDDGKTVKGLYDPWGGPYYVIMDTGYDEKVSAKTAKDTATSNLNRRAAVWSNGADGVTKGKGTSTDDVRTWEKK